MLTLLQDDLPAIRIAMKKIARTEREKLVDQANSLKQKISQRRRNGCLWAVECLERVFLDMWFIEAFTTHFPPLRKHHQKSVFSMADLVVAHGGLNKSIDELEHYLALRKANNLTQDQVDYVDEVLQILRKTRALTPQHGKTKASNHLTFSQPHCSLCWRQPSDSSHYCKRHHPSRSESEYKKAKHKLQRVAETKNIKHTKESFHDKDGKKRVYNHRLAGFLYQILGELAPHPRCFIKFCKPADRFDKEWRELAQKTLLGCIDYYPHSYEMIKKVDPNAFSTWFSWAFAIVRSLELDEVEAWSQESLANLIKDKSNWIALVSILHRHECTVVYQSFHVTFGPPKGSGKNEELYFSIYNLIQQQKKNGKINLSDIARKQKLSRQRVHKIASDNGWI